MQTQNNIYDALIIGGGVAGMQCALVLGSAHGKAFSEGKKIGIVMHQRASHLQSALFNNVLGLEAGTLGADVLEQGKAQLASLYTHVDQILNEKVLSISVASEVFTVTTNKKTYRTKLAVLALNYSNTLTIKGLEEYIEPHPKASAVKDRIWIKNTDHLVTKNLYVCGTIAGHRSQFAIAAGSGAAVATDVLTLWNDGKHTKVHDKVKSV